MGEITVILLIVAVICAALVICFMGTLLIRKSTEVALKREEQNALVQIEREKNDRILQVEELKTERTRLSNEKTAIYANRDMVSAQLEAGVLGTQKEEEGGLTGIISALAPVVMQNPDLLSKLSGLFGNKNGAPVVPAGGAEGAPSPFPGTVAGGN